MRDSTVLDDRADQANDDGTTGNATARGRHPWPEALVIARDLAIVVVATLVPLVVVFRLWDGGLGNPFTYFGDSHFYGGVAQNIIQTGWYQHTDRLGAPTGQQMYDFPLGGDNFWWLVMRVMALFTSDWALLVNLFYLLGFVLSAVSAFFALRWMGGHRVTSTAAAVLYAFAPYHFIRGTSHLVYASYAVVPIGVVLAVRVARPPPVVGYPRRRLPPLAADRRLGGPRRARRLVQLVLRGLLRDPRRNSRGRLGRRGPQLAPRPRRCRDHPAHRRGARHEPVAVDPLLARARQERPSRTAAGAGSRCVRAALRSNAHADPGPPGRAIADAVRGPLEGPVQLGGVDVPRRRRRRRAPRHDRLAARARGPAPAGRPRPRR